MINKENSSFYLRYLSKVTDSNPISYEQIPKLYQDYFSIPVLSQTLNISIKYPHVRWSKVENYFENNKFSSFYSVAEGISREFIRSIDKLYAAYYFTAHHIKYDTRRCLQKDKEAIAIETLFKIQKGICNDFCDFFIQLSKQCGLTSKKMKIVKFTNCPKKSVCLGYELPKNLKIDHSSVFIEYKGEEFICDPTFGSGYLNDDGEFVFFYNKSYFLIPFAKGMLMYYPKDLSISSFQFSYSYEQFKSLIKPNLMKELSIESTYLQLIRVEKDQYEMYFSFIQPCKRIESDLFFLKENVWNQTESDFAFFNCVDKDVPNHMFSMFPEKKRCRYKMTVSFPNKGLWEIKVFVDSIFLFNVYFDVRKTCEKILRIPGFKKEENGFIPIEPVKGLTTIDNGIAQIRFAIKLKRSPILTKLFEIKKGTLTRKSEKEIKVVEKYVTVNLPFEHSSENNEDNNDRLVEDWVWIEFPKNGRWEVEFYFKNDGNDFSYGVKYFFDVNGAKTQTINPIYNIPITRTFAPFIKQHESYFRVEPSLSTIVLYDEYDFDFTVFSDQKLTINLNSMDNTNAKTIFPVLISQNDTNKKNVKEQKYSISFPKCGCYKLKYFGNEFIGSQMYFIVNKKLPNESPNEKKLMKNLKDQINGIYDSDVDEVIKTNVKKMLQLQNLNTIKNDNSTDQINNEVEEDLPKIKKKIRKRKENNDEKGCFMIENTEINQQQNEIKKKKTPNNLSSINEEIELTTIQEEKNKLQNKIKTLEQEKEMLRLLLKDKEEKEKKMKNDIDDYINEKVNKRIEQYKAEENIRKMESEQKILELTLKIEKMEKLFDSHNHSSIGSQNDKQDLNDNCLSVKNQNIRNVECNNFNNNDDTNPINKEIYTNLNSLNTKNSNYESKLIEKDFIKNQEENHIPSKMKLPPCKKQNKENELNERIKNEKYEANEPSPDVNDDFSAKTTPKRKRHHRMKLNDEEINKDKNSSEYSEIAVESLKANQTSHRSHSHRSHLHRSHVLKHEEEFHGDDIA